MATATETQDPTAKQLVRKAIQSNLVIQNSLTTQASQLEAQLKELDGLIVCCYSTLPCATTDRA